MKIVTFSYLKSGKPTRLLSSSELSLRSVTRTLRLHLHIYVSHSNYCIMLKQKYQKILTTLTPAQCCVKQWTGLREPWWFPSHIFNKLSFPPLARYFPSSDHASPQTSCVCLQKVPMWCWATRTSWLCTAPLREPLQKCNV